MMHPEPHSVEIQYAYAHSAYRNPEIHSVQVKKYPDGMPLIEERPKEPIRKFIVRPKSMETFVAAMFWAASLMDRGYMDNHTRLILPFVPGSRQDRLNPDGDALFTLKSVAKMVNSLNFAEVYVSDPHSDVTLALIDRCQKMTFVGPWEDKYDYVISPDAGAEKRASQVAKYLGVPLLHGWKTRDVATGKISGFGIQDFPLDLKRPPTALIVDDICDGGGTFLGLRDMLPYYGQIDLFVTHGIFSQGTEKLLSKFRKVICTDSVIGDKPGVIIKEVCRDLITNL